MKQPHFTIIEALALILLLALLLLFSTNARAQQDNFVGTCSRDYACTLATGVSWANGNQVWRFVPLWPNESIRIFIHNNNTSNGHNSQVVSAWLTGSKTVSTLLANSDQWDQLAIIDNSILGAQCANVNANAPTAAPGANGMATCYTVGMYAAQIAIQITGAASQAGSTDTFDLTIVQQQSVYPGGPQPGNDPGAGSPSDINIKQIAGALVSQTASQGNSPIPGAGNPVLPVQSAAQLSAAWNSSLVNPFPAGCIVNGTTTRSANRGQYMDCDATGRPVVTGQTTQGASFSGLNPVVIGIQDGSGNAQAASSSNPVPVTFPTTSADPCANVNVEPSGVTINITSATTTLLVAINGSTSTYICGTSFTMVGAAETIQFVTGTQVTNPCDTGQVALTGAYTDGTASDLIVSIGYANRKIFGGTVPTATSAKQICAVTTGTVSIKGHMSFIQQ